MMMTLFYEQMNKDDKLGGALGVRLGAGGKGVPEPGPSCANATPIAVAMMESFMSAK